MKIYFCDICNESIPLKDINSNRISIEEGKIFCQKCAPSKAGSGAPIPTLMLVAMGMVILAVIAVGVGSWMLASEQADSLKRLDDNVSSLKGELSDLPGRMTGLESRVAKLGERVQKIGDDLSMARSELQQRHEELDEREQTNHALQTKITQDAINGINESLTAGIAEAKERISAVGTELRSDVRLRIKVLEEKVGLLQDVVTAGGVAGPSSAAVEPTSAKPTRPVDNAEDREINVQIEKLGDSDPGKRYSAVIALGRYSGAKVIKALEGVLTDSEDYVRVAVIQDLRKLGAVSSIPHVIGALRDKDYFVRVAARGALRSLTNHKLDYDPDASSSDRETKVKAWEKWWGANKEKFLGTGA